jgi:RNA polymerase subunit RPABC4/transcription elongation factor Spt4
MRFKANEECLYCNEVYKIEDHTTCPNCAVNTDTKNITIITLEEEKE